MGPVSIDGRQVAVAVDLWTNAWLTAQGGQLAGWGSHATPDRTDPSPGAHPSPAESPVPATGSSTVTLAHWLRPIHSRPQAGSIFPSTHGTRRPPWGHGSHADEQSPESVASGLGPAHVGHQSSSGSQLGHSVHRLAWETGNDATAEKLL